MNQTNSINEDQFEVGCKCKIHEYNLKLYEVSSHKRLYKINSSHDYSRAVYNYLVDWKLLGQYASYVCDICIEHGKYLMAEGTEKVASDVRLKKFVVENAPQDAVVPDTDDSDMVIEKIDEVMAKIRMNGTKRVWSERVKQKVSELVSLIGKVFVGDLIGDEYNQIQSLYKNANYMSTLNTRSFLAERNLTLMSFLRSVLPQNRSDLYQLAMVVENIYHLKNSNLVLPHCFLSNLIQTFISGSKTVTSINGKVLAGGGDTTYRNYLQDNAKPISYPSGDSDIFIDNVGKYINKLYRVSHVKNATPNVVTACINIPLTMPSSQFKDLQRDAKLKPGNWQQGLSEEEIQNKMRERIEEGQQDFRVFRLNYITSVFKCMTPDFEEMVDDKVKKISTPLK